MRSRTRGQALGSGREGPALPQGALECRVHRSQPSICASVLGFLGSARPALPVPRHFAPGREGKGRDAEREGKEEARKGRDATRARRVPGAPAARPARYRLSTTPPSRGDPLPSFLPLFPFEVGSAAGAPFLPRRRSPSRAPFPLLSRTPAALAGIPRSRIPGPSRREGTGGQRPAGPDARPRHPPPFPEPSRIYSPHPTPHSPAPKSLSPESWGGAGAVLAEAEGAGAGRAMPRSRGGPAAAARPAIKN